MTQPVDLKVPLSTNYQRKTIGRFGGGVSSRVTMALPLYCARIGTRAHRVRRATLINWDDGMTAISIDFWCGNTGNTRRGRLLAVPPPVVPVCGTCEGRAVGAGYPGIAILQQRYELLYSPREGRAPAAASREASA